MNTAQMEEEWDGLKRRIHVTWAEGTHQGLSGPSGNTELTHEKVNELFGMASVQSEKAVEDLKEIHKN